MPLLNQGIWGGVCGFVSVLHALGERDGSLAGEAGGGKGSQTLHLRLGVEMKVYLKLLQVNNPALAKEIEDYTRTFGGFEKATLNEAIAKIDQAARTSALFQHQWVFKSKESLCGGVGMTLGGVIDYLGYVGLRHQLSLTNATNPFTQTELNKYRDCVIGVGKKENAGNAYKGLRHWVYVDKTGSLWNWGKKTPMTGGSKRPYEELDTLHNCTIHALKIK